jgi:hypothetical protein
MKKFLLTLALILLASTYVSAQSQVDFPANFKADNADLEITYTNFTAASDDTTNDWSSIFPGGIQTMVGLAHEVYLYCVTTDSMAADIYVLLRLSQLTSLTSSYTDSVVIAADAGGLRIITMKDGVTNRMTIYDQIKIGTVFRATGQGNTTGRTAKWYLKFVL